MAKRLKKTVYIKRDSKGMILLGDLPHHNGKAFEVVDRHGNVHPYKPGQVISAEGRLSLEEIYRRNDAADRRVPMVMNGYGQGQWRSRPPKPWSWHTPAAHPFLQMLADQTGDPNDL
jgi:hypothetical protein